MTDAPKEIFVAPNCARCGKISASDMPADFATKYIRADLANVGDYYEGIEEGFNAGLERAAEIARRHTHKRGAAAEAAIRAEKDKT